MSNERKLINLSKENKTETKDKTEKLPQKQNSEKAEKKKQNNSNKKVSSKSFRMISKDRAAKKKSRYNIYINDDFAFGVDEKVLIKFELSKGLHVSKELQKKIENEDSYYKAYQKTLNYLVIPYVLKNKSEII